MNPYHIVFLAVGGALTLITLYIASLGRKKKPYTIPSMCVDAFLIALVALMSFIPQIGYLSIIPGLSFTLVHLPVLLGALIGGRRKGLLLGTAFGVSSLFVAMTQPYGLNALFILPYVSIPPRMLFGYLSGLFFELCGKAKGKKGLLIPVICFLSTVMHTVLVFTDLFIFAYGDVSSFFATSSVIGEGIAISFLALIGLGMLGEATLAAIVVAPIDLAIKKALPRFYEKVSFGG